MGLETKVSLSYKQQKRMKKFYGKLLAQDIAFGRALRKIIHETRYQPERLNPEASKEDAIV